MTTAPKKSSRPPKAPLLLRMIRTGLRWLGRIAPGLSARLAYRLWFYPRRYQEPVREKNWLQDAERLSIVHGQEQLAAYKWGSGPVVLLVHGWDGRGSQLAGFAAPLAMAGYRAVALDLPAHGRSSGKKSNMVEAAEAILDVAGQIGPVEAVIAHSFGAGAVARSLSKGLVAQKVVLISPPANLRWMADNYYEMLGLPRQIQRRVEELVNREFGESIWQAISADHNLRGSSIPGLIVHDLDDRDVPFAQGQRIAEAWPGARLLETRGLGHRRILRDRDVIASCVDFIQAPTANH